ncbi:MAG: hypothetical protein O2794_01080 [bacterium]|nr:hypothetical protein [bacterium]
MFFNQAPKEKLGVAFDIGTASVSAVVFEVSAGGRPNILKIFRRFHKISTTRESGHFSRATLSHISDTLEDIRKLTVELKKPTPETFTIGLSAIFYLGKTIRLKESYKSQKNLSEKDVNGFLDRAKEKFLKDLGRDDVVVFESLIMKALLNGYPVERPIGKGTTELDLSVHLAATSKEFYDKVTEIINTFHRGAKIRLSTFPVVSWSLMRELITPEHQALLVDIGGEVTEVTFLADGVMTEVLTLPFGVYNILLRIAESEKTDPENALSLLIQYTSGKLSKAAQARIQIIIKKEMKNWEQIFERVWQRASRDIMSNIKVFFLGGGALIEDMKNSVVPPLLHPEIARGLHAVTIAPAAFQDKFGAYSGLEGPGDFGLVALVLSSQI